MVFEVRRIPFGLQPGQADEDLDGAGIPAPKLIKMRARRAAAITEAKAILEHLPGPGESLHALCTRRLDLADVIAVMLDKIGSCERMRIATLGYHGRNLKTMLRWLDDKQVGELTLLASIFFRSHNGQLWESTIEEFHKRGQKCHCAASHAKVVTMQMPSCQHYVIEGSSNLCGNGSAREQIAIIRDVGLHDWHSSWIDEMVSHAGS